MSKLKELFERYKREGFPSRLTIQLDMEQAVKEEEQGSLDEELQRFVLHRTEQGKMIYPHELDDMIKRHKGE